VLFRSEYYVEPPQYQFTGATYNSAAVDSIRFFAAEAARFHQTARDWKPGADINIPYSNLTEQWMRMRNKSARLQATTDIRSKIERVNEMMADLGRLTNTGGGAVRPAHTGVTEPVVPSSEQKTRLFSEPQPKPITPPPAAK
jgi:hypothetical protein